MLQTKTGCSTVLAHLERVVGVATIPWPKVDFAPTLFEQLEDPRKIPRYLLAYKEQLLPERQWILPSVLARPPRQCLPPKLLLESTIVDAKLVLEPRLVDYTNAG